MAKQLFVRRLPWALASIFPALSLCAPAGLAKTTITFLCNWYNVPTQVDTFKKMVADFEKANPNIKVKITMGGNEDKMKTTIAAGSAPDVSQFPRYNVPQWARDGLLTPLDTYFPSAKKDFLPVTIQDSCWEGKLYAIPMTTEIRGLFWNKKLFEQAGLDPSHGPKTWDDVLRYSQKLTRKGSDGKYQQFGFMPWGGNWGIIGWIFTFGGDYYNPQTGKPSCDKPENIKALDWMGWWAKTQFSPSDIDRSGIIPANTALGFAKDRLGMEVAHYGQYPGWYVPTNPSIQVWGGEMPHPPGGRNGTFSAGSCYMIPRGSRHKAEAAKLIAWMTRPESFRTWYMNTRDIPTTFRGLDITEDLNEPLEKIFLKQLPVSNAMRPFTNMIRPYLETARADVLSGRKTAAAALKEAQELCLKQHPSLWKDKVQFKIR